MEKISAVLITYNEAENLENNLKYVLWCDEIIVVDSGSTDQTISIAKKYGAQVIYRKFDSFGLQKNFAVDQCHNDWVFSIDADEIVSSELKCEIQSLLSNPSRHLPYVAYNIPIRLFFMNREIKYWFSGANSTIRLFRKSAGNFNFNSVHEKVIIQGSVGQIRNALKHYSYKNLSHYFEKLNFYTSMGAHDLFNKGKKAPNLLELLLRFPIKFFTLYLIRGGFLIGIPGFTWCLLSSLYPIVKYLKLREKYDLLDKKQTESLPSRSASTISTHVP